ncbi:hypothetical protein P170DRAFT_424381 [Aspergillus steynii IBT 23096]|uniref:C6 zinc finger domain protein n=1 Tax=Aspergillus steynii IBT 23096 TaxID=1392250 RepID=A0A2I2GAQ4_9EURO|nr:uncharacterized protein P170DRAFT_424381 [Aspergillus steynii IBT 23096]PLB49948.1 hypothetical protein P170DRAFT_424381 [Aspergillus steynii IBT 23096]
MRRGPHSQNCVHAQCDGRAACSRCKDPSRTRSVASRDPSPSSHVLPKSTQQAEIPRTGRIIANYQPLSLLIDETVSPSLTATALADQQTEVFTNYILACFPCYFKCTEKQVPVNWIEYVDRRRGSPGSSPADWALRSCTSAYMGALYHDARFTHAGRDLYLRALRGLAVLLCDPDTAKSDECLSTAISLAIYEKHHCTEPDAWLRHAAGIRTLMKLRGPAAHVHGFGRALYLAYRHFLITHALISGEACFLEEPKWQALNEQIISDNAKLPDSSLYTDVVERGSLVVTRIPGHVKKVRELRCKSGKEQTALRPALLQEVQATRAALRGIRTEFGVAVSMLRSGQKRRQGTSTREFIGPLPHVFFDRYSTLFDRGIRSGLRILNYCVMILDPSQREAVEDEVRLLEDQIPPSPSLSPSASSSASLSPEGDRSLLTPPDSPGQAQLRIKSLITPETKRPPITPWMDQIVTTMGLDGVEIPVLQLS